MITQAALNNAKCYKASSQWWRHHQRYICYVEKHGLLCQECGGSGGETVPILDDGTGPFEQCGFCEGTGLVTRWMRGLWLRWKRREKSKPMTTEEVYNNFYQGEFWRFWWGGKEEAITEVLADREDEDLHDEQCDR